MIISTYVMHCLAVLPEGVNCRKIFPTQWTAPFCWMFHHKEITRRLEITKVKRHVGKNTQVNTRVVLKMN